MKIVAFMPLKSVSRRLPGKNIRPLGGVPLCHHVANVMQSVVDCSVVYASDDEAMRYVPFLPAVRANIATNASGTDISRGFARQCEADVYVKVHATSPFLSAVSIRRCLVAVLSGRYESAMTVREQFSFSWRGGTPNYDLSNIPPTNELTPDLVESTGCYVYTRRAIEAGLRVTESPAMISVEWPEWIDIDNEIEWQQAEAASDLLCKQKARL